MAITFNIHKSRCNEYKRGKLIGYEIPCIIESLEKEGSLIARIYAKALEADNYNGEAKYYRYEVSNKSKSDIAYFKKDKAIGELIDMCKRYNDENPDKKIKYGYFKDKMGPDTMRSVFIVMPKIDGFGGVLSFHTEMDMLDIPTFTERRAPTTCATNRTVISHGLYSMFSEMFPKKESPETVTDKKEDSKPKRKPKLVPVEPLLEDVPIAKKCIKEEKKEEKGNQTHVRTNRTTNITSGMTQVEKFAERFKIFKKK